eukprot:COSAG02_NODE_4146_length_5717_cov_3.929690_6_plen_101_part_00
MYTRRRARGAFNAGASDAIVRGGFGTAQAWLDKAAGGGAPPARRTASPGRGGDAQRDPSWSSEGVAAWREGQRSDVGAAAAGPCELVAGADCGLTIERGQ